MYLTKTDLQEECSESHYPMPRTISNPQCRLKFFIVVHSIHGALWPCDLGVAMSAIQDRSETLEAAV